MATMNDSFANLDAIPPDYSNAIKDMPKVVTTDDENPPTYESVLVKLKRAGQESTNPVDYVQSVYSIICESFLITVIFAISVPIPLTMLIIGAVYNNSCPINTKIPIWLIVKGVFGCVSVLYHSAINVFVLIKRRKDPKYNLNHKNCFTVIVELFLFAWFICGNVWIYSVKNLVGSDPGNPSTYCDPVCYNFAFWMVTLSWILVGLSCCCCCSLPLIAMCGLKMVSANPRPQTNSTP